MARNRKRAKERRSQRPQRPPGSRPGVAPARSNGREDHDPELTGPEALDADAPETPEAGAGVPSPRSGDLSGEGVEEELEELEFPEEIPASLEHAAPDAEIADMQIAMGAAEASELEPETAPPPAPRRRRGPEHVEQEEVDEDIAEIRAAKSPAHAHQSMPRRLVNFVQGSWRELQRVQWPDRRQVMQATSVVIGFVIVAGVFLGVADWASQKLVNFILK